MPDVVFEIFLPNTCAFSGGESIYGAPFKDEFHSRLRFTRRGLVAMANAGKDDNASQFFFTMDQTPELMNKHTIFGKVVGNTIYNMIKLQDGIILDDDRPEYPQKILKAKVLNNPFPDIKPRKVIEMIKDDRDKKPKSKMKATKDFGLLSFGDEAEEDEEDVEDVTKMFSTKAGKSSHDLLQDPKLSSEVGSELKSNRSDSEEEFVPASKPKKPEDVMDIDSVKQKLSKKKESKKQKAPEVRMKYSEGEEDEDDDLTSKERKREDIKRQIKALKKEMKHSKDGMSKDGSKTSEDMREKIKELTEEEKKNDMLLNFHLEKEKYKEKKKKGNPKKGSAREEMTLKLLAKFKDKMHAAKQETPKEAVDDGEEEESGTGWMANTLKFESDDPVLAKDASTKDDDWFDIYDPRNPLNKRRRGEDGGKDSERKKGRRK